MWCNYSLEDMMVYCISNHLLNYEYENKEYQYKYNYLNYTKTIYKIFRYGKIR